jgi:integrase
MSKISFTKKALDNLPVKDKRYQVQDSVQPGLVIVVYPSGKKMFHVHKWIGNKAQRVVIGDFSLYGSNIELARAKAGEIVSKMVLLGANPNQEKRAARAKAITLKEAFEDYLKNCKLAPNTVTSYRLAIDRDFKDWNKKPLNRITGVMVRRRHRDLTKISESTANKAMRVLRAVFNYARDEYEDADRRSLFPDNPTRKLKRSWHKEARKTGHIPLKQMANWWAATEKLTAMRPGTRKELVPVYSGGGELARDYLQFVVLTGLRRREASGLPWSSVNLKARTFTITDTKNHKPLQLPLSDHLYELLLRRKKATGGEGLVFPIAEPKKFVDWVRRESGVHFTIHDLRRTFITVAERLDIGLLTIKALVNHSTASNDVTAGYAQIGTERLKDPMQRITDTILRAAGVMPSNVTQLNQDKQQIDSPA